MTRIVKIDWVDSCHFAGWRLEHEYKDIQISNCTSVGILIRQTEDEVVYAQSYSDTGNYAEVNAIPMCAVKKIIELSDNRVK